MHKQTGFTLLEVMIAVVVLAIGLLGMAALQGVGIRNNHSAYMRTQATMLAYDLMDRMRANMDAVNKGYYNNSTGAAVANCGTSGCSPQNMASNDLYEWNQAISAALPMSPTANTTGGIMCNTTTPQTGTSMSSTGCDNDPNAPMTIKIWWMDDKNNPTQTQMFATSFRPLGR